MLWWIKVLNSELTLASLLCFWGSVRRDLPLMTTARLFCVQRQSSNVYAMFTPKLPNALDITKAALSLIIKGCFLPP